MVLENNKEHYSGAWGAPGLVGKTAAMRADGGRIESLLGNVKFKKLIKK